MVKCNLLRIGLLVTALAVQSHSAGAKDYIADAEKLQAQGNLRAAEIELKNAVRADPQNMAAHYRLALVELNLGNPAAAEFEARAAQLGGYDPDHTVPLLAKTYLAQGKYRELLRDFPASNGSANERAGVLVVRGLALFILGKEEEGVAALNQAIELAPDFSDALTAKANYLIVKKDYAAAQSLLEEAVRLAPRDNEARVAQAQLLRIDGKLQQALQELGEIIADAPAYLPARIARAEILISQNQDAEANKDVDAILTVQPGSVSGTFLKAVLDVKNKDFDGANIELQKLSGNIGSIPRGYYLLSIVQYNLKLFAQAEDSAQRFVTRYPNDPAGEKLFAIIELNLRRPAEAAVALEKVKAAGTADAVVFDLLGRAYIQLGKTAEALESFDAAAKLAPENSSIQLHLGVSRLQSGDTTGAIGDLERSLELGATAPAAEVLVAAELAAGSWEKARAAVEQLQQAQANSPVPGTLYGLIKIAQFDLDGAQTDFVKLADQYPDYLPAKLGLARVLELQGKLDQAEVYLNSLVTANPTNDTVLARFVSVLLRAGKADAAIKAVQRAHAAALSDRGLTVELIDLYIRLGNKKEALALAQQEPGTGDAANAPLIAARARAEIASGMNKESVQTLRRLVEIVPSRVDFRHDLANAQVSAGDLTGARQTIDDAMIANPHNSTLAAHLIAIDLKASGVEHALATARQLQKDDPELPTAPGLEGEVYMAAQRYADAVDAYAKAFEQVPSPVLANLLAQAKSAAGSTQGAIDVLRDWLKSHPDHMGIAEILANYEIVGGQYDDAQKHLEQVVQTTRPNAAVLNNLAWLYQRAGDPRARELAERAYLLAPDTAQVADTLGWILVEQKAAATGLGLLQEASAKAPQNLEIQFHLAVAFNDTGHRDKAIELLKPLMEDKATFDDKLAAKKLFAEISKP